MRRPEFIARQSRCPTGVLGRLIGHIMSAETAAANADALSALDLQPGDRVLEVGFGPGRTIEHAASSVPIGFVVGIDRSEAMARMTVRRCRHLLRDRKVAFAVGDSGSLPLPDEHFDKVLSVHTVYFWVDPAAHLREVRRVLRSGGRFVLGFRSEEDGMARDFPDTVYRFYTAAEVRDLLQETGFQRVDVARRQGGFVVATAHRSGAGDAP